MVGSASLKRTVLEVGVGGARSKDETSELERVGESGGVDKKRSEPIRARGGGVGSRESGRAFRKSDCLHVLKVSLEGVSGRWRGQTYGSDRVGRTRRRPRARRRLEHDVLLAERIEGGLESIKELQGGELGH